MTPSRQNATVDGGGREPGPAGAFTLVRARVPVAVARGVTDTGASTGRLAGS